MNPLTRIPAKYRLWIYSAFFLVGVFFGACDVAGAVTLFGASLETCLDVYAYLGIALGLTAASNVDSRDVPKPAPVDNPLNERGQGGVLYVLLVVLVVLVILALVGAL